MLRTRSGEFHLCHHIRRGYPTHCMGSIQVLSQKPVSMLACPSHSEVVCVRLLDSGSGCRRLVRVAGARRAGLGTAAAGNVWHAVLLNGFSCVLPARRYLTCKPPLFQRQAKTSIPGSIPLLQPSFLACGVDPCPSDDHAPRAWREAGARHCSPETRTSLATRNALCAAAAWMPGHGLDSSALNILS